MRADRVKPTTVLMRIGKEYIVALSGVELVSKTELLVQQVEGLRSHHLSVPLAPDRGFEHCLKVPGAHAPRADLPPFTNDLLESLSCVAACASNREDGDPLLGRED